LLARREASPDDAARASKNRRHPLTQPPKPKQNQQTSADAFTALVARCPVLNVRARDPAMPPVDTSHFSCFGVFENPEAFRAYANGTASAPKGSYAAQNGALGMGRGSSVLGVAVAALAVAVGGGVMG
jgi:hypothetical protein